MRDVIFSVVANRRQPHRTGENPPWVAGAYPLVACFFVHPLTMHPCLATFLTATPPKDGRSFRLFSRHVCLSYLSLRIAIVSSLFSSLQNYSMSHISSSRMPPVNTFPHSLYISHSLTMLVLLSMGGAQGHTIAGTCSSSRRLEFLILRSARFRFHALNCSFSYFALPLGRADTFDLKYLPLTPRISLRAPLLPLRISASAFPFLLFSLVLPSRTRQTC